jgi:hypothetical protein
MSSSTAPATPSPNPPPIPLRRMPQMAPSAGASAAENAFLAHNAVLQRNLTGNRVVAPTTPRTFTAPIPLQLSGQAAQVMPLRPLPRVPVAPLPSPPAAAPAEPSLPAAAARQGAPADIAQRMREALDKYQRLEAQRPATIDLRQ